MIADASDWTPLEPGRWTIEPHLWFDGNRDYVQGAAVISEVNRFLYGLPLLSSTRNEPILIKHCKFARKINKSGQFVAMATESVDTDSVDRAAMVLKFQAGVVEGTIVYLEGSGDNLSDRRNLERGKSVLGPLKLSGDASAGASMSGIVDADDLLYGLVALNKEAHLSHLGREKDIRFGFLSHYRIPRNDDVVGKQVSASVTLSVMREEAGEAVTMASISYRIEGHEEQKCQMCFYATDK